MESFKMKVWGKSQTKGLNDLLRKVELETLVAMNLNIVKDAPFGDIRVKIKSQILDLYKTKG